MADDDEIQRALGRIETKIDATHSRLMEHHHTLHGNGEPGLKSEVQVIKEHLRELRGADESATKASRAAIVSIGTLIAGFGAWIAQALGIKVGN